MSTDFNQRMAAIKRRFINELPNYIQLLDDYEQALRANWDAQHLEEFKFAVHKIKGSSGTLRFDALFYSLKLLDQIIKQHLNAPDDMTHAEEVFSAYQHCREQAYLLLKANP